MMLSNAALQAHESVGTVKDGEHKNHVGALCIKVEGIVDPQLLVFMPSAATAVGRATGMALCLVGGPAKGYRWWPAKGGLDPRIREDTTDGVIYLGAGERFVNMLMIFVTTLKCMPIVELRKVPDALKVQHPVFFNKIGPVLLYSPFKQAVTDLGLGATVMYPDVVESKSKKRSRGV